MDLTTAKKLIKQHTAGHSQFVTDADTAERYYRNRNDILNDDNRKGKEEETPLRNADNRVPHNFHGLLVNQKASYMFTYPPLFDAGNEESNKKVSDILGDKFPKICKSLCIKASNCKIAWLHYWVDESNQFRYGVVDGKQVIPVWTDDLDQELKTVLRQYQKTTDNGKTYIIYEIWTDTECQSFCREIDGSLDKLTYYSMYDYCVIDIENEENSHYQHKLGRVPFIPFFNNDTNTGDLENIKGLIDTYDKVYSGFANDLEDIQEIIFVLSGYGGTDLKEFLDGLKKYKTVKLDPDQENPNPGLSTLTIDIPVEAREKMLSMTRKEIFEQGQGVDPQPENHGNASGEALKFLYSLLELKAGLMETEFRIGFSEFVHAICNFLGIACQTIQQTWTRNMIRSDSELAGICADSVGVISNKTIVKNHPYVEDPQKELDQIKKEKAQQEENHDYDNAFTKPHDGKEGDLIEE